MVGAQGRAQPRQLRHGRLAGQALGVDLNGTAGQRRARSPHRRQGVEVGAQGDAAPAAELGGKGIDHGGRRSHAVDAGRRATAHGKLTGNPLGNAGSAVDTLAHEHIAGAAKGLLGSYEVTRVGPQGSSVQCHHRRTGRTAKATHPLAALPVVGHVLAAMRGGAGKDEGVEPLAPHHLPQLSQSVFNVIIHRVKL